MKKMLVVLAAMAFVIVMVGGAYAADTKPEVNVNATVANVCSSSNNGVIDFGALDAVADAGGKSGTVTTAPTIHCTAGDTYSVSAIGDNGGTTASGASSGFRLYNGTSYIAYSFTFNDPITGQGFATSIGGTGAGNLAINPSIGAGALSLATAGTYSDKITFTISY